MKARAGQVLAGCLLAAASQAAAQAPQAKGPPQAQKAPPAKAAEAGKTVDSVTVTGAARDGTQISIDRRSYGIANDLAATTGSISDALRNVPSVEVAADGTVSLRGSPNVRLLIDGKPSTQLSGPNAALALQAMAADGFERVEVITNPGADISPEGAAGVINLVTKGVRKLGKTLTVRGFSAAAGRMNGGLSGSYSVDKLTLTADLSARRNDPGGMTGGYFQERFDAAGALVETQDVTMGITGRTGMRNARLAAEYDLDARTRLSGDVRRTRVEYDRDIAQRFDTLDMASATLRTTEVDVPLGATLDTTALQATLRRNYSADGRHQITLNASHDQTDERGWRDILQGGPPPLFLGQDARNRTELTQAKADYVRPIAGSGAELKAGYAFRLDDSLYRYLGRIGVSESAARPDPGQTNTFRFQQAIHAGYASYQRPFGALTMLAGVRLEAVSLDLEDIPGERDYLRLYPSLHLSYKLSDRQSLSASYARRIERPTATDFNPFANQMNGAEVYIGNPGLKPQITDSFEAGWQHRREQTNYLATLFYRDSRNGISPVEERLPDGRLLESKANIGVGRTLGLELVASGRLSRTVTYSTSGNAAWTEIEAQNVGLVGAPLARRQSGVVGGGRGSLTWQPTAKDTFQASAVLNARRLTLQGDIRPMRFVFLGYRHKFNDRLAGVVTVNDVFDTARAGARVSSPTLRTRSDFALDSRAVFLGLTWTFNSGSAPKPREPGFEFAPP